MNTTLLKQKILDLAIRGKLTEQNLGEHPIDVPTFEDEVPFEIPENWVWTKLSEITQINPKNNLEDNLEVSFVPMTLIDDKFSSKFTFEIKKWGEIKKGYTHFQNDDVGIAKITPCFENRKSIHFHDLENEYGAGTTELHIFRAEQNKLFPKYLLWFLKTDYLLQLGQTNFTGAVGQQRVGKNIFAECPIPIPPIAEQKRIIDMIQRLFSEIDKLEQNKIELKDLIKTTKQKILDLAIKGKLTEKDKNEVPMDVPTFDSEEPFEIPSNWVWTELENVLQYEQPTPYIVNSTEYDDNYNIPVLTAGKSFILGYTNENNGIKQEVPVIIFDDFTTDSKYVNFPFKVKSSAMKILNLVQGDLKYIYYTMQLIECNHSTHKRYWISDFAKRPIPVPPLAEQKRIVSKVEALFAQLDIIEEKLEEV